jgi:hypothetical protein
MYSPPWCTILRLPIPEGLGPSPTMQGRIDAYGQGGIALTAEKVAFVRVVSNGTARYRASDLT